MIASIPLLAAVIGAAVLDRHLRRQNISVPGCFLYLTAILPFLAGGFHTYTAWVTTLLLLAQLLTTAFRRGRFFFRWNLSSAAVICLVLGYCLTPLWAADRGAAPFGILRFMPVLLYMLVLMQLSPEEKKHALTLVPISGAFMTVLSGVLALFPAGSQVFLVNGRLCGCFQYPNAFAAFLLAGLILVQAAPFSRSGRMGIGAVLLVGIFLSGSKTGLLLLAVTIPGFWVVRKGIRAKSIFILTLLLGCALILVLANLESLLRTDWFYAISPRLKSFLLRALYYEDALPVILRSPFGCGYGGYRALLGTFQRGSYSVSYVHNGLLQLLLDIGWFPALLLAAALGQALLGQNRNPWEKLMLYVVLAHCMLDFDLEFFIFWVLLLSCLDFDTGKQYSFRPRRGAALAVCGLLLSVCSWLGASDLAFRLGKTELCLAVTPFHSQALSLSLQSSRDIDQLDALADRLLRSNPTSALACSAKANAAFSRGKIQDMIRWKEQAIRCAPYALEEYTDYIDKLAYAMQLYAQSGDNASAIYCRDKLLAIPGMMEAVLEASDPLAFETDDASYLTLPQEYQSLIHALSEG